MIYYRYMNIIILQGLLIPFLGTTLGSACVLFLNSELDEKLIKILTGFASGVMVAASFFSLLLPSIEQSSSLGKLSFMPAAIGFCVGMLFLLLLDLITPHMHIDESVEGPRTNLKKTTMMVLAVVLHNIPEGMAVGVLYAGLASTNITLSSALSLSIGIAIQNFPEGAIISMPLKANGESKLKAFINGTLSGIVEPIAGIITILLSGIIVPLLPYLLAFAAGAMFYVVVEELIPSLSQGKHSNNATIFFMIGFVLMMILDVALG